MGLPKKKLSKTRKRTRAAHSALEKIYYGICTKCNHPVLPHKVCQFCGYYRGRDVLRLSQKPRPKAGSPLVEKGTEKKQ